MSILKGSASADVRAARKSSGIAWDESNLGENDAYLASTTRERIDEPKTPYSGPIDLSTIDDATVDDSSMPSQRTTRDSDRRQSHEQNNRLLRGSADLNALTDEALRRREGPPAALASSADEHGDEFAAKRKAHYNEFLKVKELREKGVLADAEEDDDKA